jgi:hypothetical protein
VTLKARYVRLTADHYSLTLHEILFKDAYGDTIYPASIIANSGENATVNNLLDEQDTFEGGYPSWYNSTYFDEIYHARTGYEHLHHLQTYETTHPPLGKVFISWCIAIFGMTPFGWRFAGALAGVLMLPGMYLLGSVLWPRLSLLKTFAASQILSIAVMIIAITLTNVLIPEDEIANWLKNIVESGTLTNWIAISLGVQAVLYWGLSWYLFKRKDVVSLKWWK